MVSGCRRFHFFQDTRADGSAVRALAGLGTGYSRVHQLRPEAFTLVVVEQDIALVQTSGDPKREGLAVDLAGVDHPRLGQRSECGHKGLTAHGIVDRFVPGQNLDGIGPRHTSNDDTDDLVVPIQVIRLVGSDKFRVKQRRDAVLGRPAGKNFRWRHDGVVDAETRKRRQEYIRQRPIIQSD
jgi:hypothetical protein